MKFYQIVVICQSGLSVAAFKNLPNKYDILAALSKEGFLDKEEDAQTLKYIEELDAVEVNRGYEFVNGESMYIFESNVLEN